MWKLHPVVALHYLSLFAMLMAYPVVVIESLLSGVFWDLAMFHLGVLAVFGVVYWFGTRSYPAAARVDPFWFLPMAALMPITYLLYTPLALLTLDSSSWETRGGAVAPPGAAASEESESEEVESELDLQVAE